MIFPEAQEKVKVCPAATVMLVRDVDEGGMEVYMTRRHQSLVFLGGYYVFPGGRMDESDCQEGVEDLFPNLSEEQAAEILKLKGNSHSALGYWAAAIRELFEEADVLLACDQNGEIPSLADPDTKEKMAKYREILQQDKITMPEMLRKEGLYYADDKLCYHSHWITPPGGVRRFDTRFFFAELPEDQSPEHYVEEAEEGIWIEPSEALDKMYRKEIKLIPPTIQSLKALAQHSSSESLFLSHVKT